MKEKFRQIQPQILPDVSNGTFKIEFPDFQKTVDDLMKEIDRRNKKKLESIKLEMLRLSILYDIVIRVNHKAWSLFKRDLLEYIGRVI